ncbi:hypothetical protein XENTR_v10009766 [Xenopus tropicalis]|nr:hypothetical protein XENTR_v10009766 [Xenopus tropicalis]
MYLLAIFGNLITLIICLVSKLHRPMYFFLCYLALLDIIYVSTTLPKLMAITITGDNSISLNGCIIQMFMFATCVMGEFFLLAFMAYDRYVAICIPLRYSVIMNKRTCKVFANLSWLCSSLNAVIYCIIILNLPFCQSHDINNIYCGLKTIVKLSCGDITQIETFMSIESIFLGLLPFMLIITSYIFIINAILKIPTSTGRAKTFSSCSSHITTVIIFYVIALMMYMKPESEYSQEQEKVLTLLYATVIPILNPLVYSLRNTEILQALNKIMHNILLNCKVNQRQSH